MKKNKFRIEIIEKGRLSRKESSEIVGGVASCPDFSFNCSPTFMSACAILTSCKPFEMCSTIDTYITCTLTKYATCQIDQNGNGYTPKKVNL